MMYFLCSCVPEAHQMDPGAQLVFFVHYHVVLLFYQIANSEGLPMR